MKIAFVEIAGFRGFKDLTRFNFDPGFAVLTGRNGVGKSSVFDAIDFALTGSINKYQVKGAKGGGLDNHIWWIGDGTPLEQYVSVGFVDDAGGPVVVRRSREKGLETDESTISGRLCTSPESGPDWAQTLMQTSLIRDEMIAALSLDLSEQARFSAVQAAMGSPKGTDHSERTRLLLKTAETARNAQESRVNALQADLGRALGTLTEVRSAAISSSELAEAGRLIGAVLGTDFAAGVDATAKLRSVVTERRVSIAELQAVATEAEGSASEYAYFSSPASQNDLQSLLTEQSTLESSLPVAAGRMKTAQAVLDSERELDSLTVHLSALLEHGEAVGLIEGHCPLCDAVRGNEDFSSALLALRTRLSESGERARLASLELQNATLDLAKMEESLANAKRNVELLVARQTILEEKQRVLSSVLAKYAITLPSLDPATLRQAILRRREETASLEQALSILEASSAADRIASSETRVANFRTASEAEQAKLNTAERALEVAKQIDKASKVVANELLTEQFDTVLPLLKELYLRLRPHAEWREIETDIAGHVRASLNFTVGDGKNPQFLFSSGQRRAAGIAFLLAIHMSRPWCAFQTLLLDDPVQHIDDYRALNLVEVLSAIRRTGRQVIVAVEDAALADLLSRRLRSTANDGGKRFELSVATDGSATIANEVRLLPLPSSILEAAEAS